MCREEAGQSEHCRGASDKAKAAHKGECFRIRGQVLVIELQTREARSASDIRHASAYV